MENGNSLKIAPWLSLPLAAIVILASYVGIFTPDFYYQETPNWQAQSVAQDWANLVLIVPVLLITSLLGHDRKGLAQQIWAGTVLFLLYTYTIYCFGVHFNSLFVVYCSALGLSFYSFLYYMEKESKITDPVHESRPWIVSLTGLYFILIAVVFYLLWLSEIIPSILEQKRPISLEKTGLLTNPVHILDLSVLLPGMLFTGIMILKGKPIGLRLAPVFLSFFILMDISIAWLVVVMHQRGLTPDPSIAGVMSILALFSLIVLVLFHTNCHRYESYPSISS